MRSIFAVGGGYVCMWRCGDGGCVEVMRGRGKWKGNRDEDRVLGGGW